ncbi:MAG: mucoidy inhibitor MuiA family protein [Hyphomicrobiaceae bacterium]|nr:mucoidy inhibitor MuiA family protein [Hyphomicrobiaceae bacterium]
MIPRMIPVFAALLVAVPAADAAEVPGRSSITAVTVFPSGAEVVRKAVVKLEPGQHAVVLGGLPAQAVPGSIRVEAESTAKLEIGSVDSRRLFVPRSDAEAAGTAQRQMELQIERLNDRKLAIENDIEAGETQRALLRNLSNLPSRPAPSGAQGTGAPGEDWPGVLNLIGSSMTDIGRSILESRVRIREIDREIAELENKRAELSPEQEERTEVKVFVSADAAQEATFLVRYQVPSASWQPFYDARLSTGSKAAVPKLELIRRAAISQTTGEPWTDVEVTLSTSRPKAGSTAPDLQPITVDVVEPVQARPVSAPVAPVGQISAAPEPMAEVAAADEAAHPKSARRAIQMAPARVQEAVVESSPFQALYRVPGAVTVADTGEAKRVQLSRQEIGPTLSIKTVPKLDDRAYLYAKFKSPAQAPLLPGSVSLFRDGTFVGTGRLPLVAGGEERELGFGTDDLVRVRHAIAEETRGETGLISSSRTDVRQYKITVKNLHERAIDVTVLDQMPAVKNEAITVDLVGRTPPTKRDVDDKRGVVAWDVSLAPDEEKSIDFGYKVTWPAAKQIRYGR